jgi:hypothetical protein
MIPYRDDVLISEQIVQDLVNQFNNLTQEEKEKFFKKVLCIGSLAVDSLDTVTALISILIAIYRKYSEKHPDVPIEKFTKAFLKDISTYDDSWMENFLPLCKAITDCKKVNLCGPKNLEECKSKITSVLDKLLPF